MGNMLTRGNFSHTAILIFAIVCFSWTSPLPADAAPIAPPPNPPEIFHEGPAPVPDRGMTTQAVTPTTEWTYHKTSDNLHPSGMEQQLMWLMNRARANPTAEGAWLANTGNADVINATNFFNVDLDILQSEFAAIPAKPPAAFDVRLYNAALAHSLDLIDRNTQDHGLLVGSVPHQFFLLDDNNFSYQGCGGSVYSFAKGGIHTHAAWNIDWGNSDNGTGMQTDRGHRHNTMSIDREYYNVGISAVSEADGVTFPTEPSPFGIPVGPYVVTGNYCQANTFATDEYQRFLVGTVWQDLNGNSMYDPGEGLTDVKVTPEHGAFYAFTADSGGYAVPITSAGVYHVTFAGAGLPPDAVKTVDVGSDSVLLDYVVGAEPEGDINGDGVVDLTDAVLALLIITGQSTPPGVLIHLEADINGDNLIGIPELVYITQKITGVRQ